jgi:hypothetical protein
MKSYCRLVPGPMCVSLRDRYTGHAVHFEYGAGCVRRARQWAREHHVRIVRG